jgi:DNA invertase Pin-like site-specific DNA recombinase
MLNQADPGPDPWEREPSPYDQCQGVDELLLVMHRLCGLDAVDAALAEAKLFREHLREAADRLDRVGLKPLAQLIRRHARRAKPNPYRFQRQTKSALIFIARRRGEAGRLLATFGYARVSTDGQTLAAQDAALHAAGCAKVYAETASGAKTDRAELRKVLKRLGEGDTLIVTRLDRLARSTRDLLNTLHEITRKGAGFRSLADVWADTTTPHGRLILTVLGGLAEFEHELIKARTGEGRARAKAAGVHMGRPSKLTKHQQREAIARRDAGEALTDIARTFGVSHTTIGRLTAAPSV